MLGRVFCEGCGVAFTSLLYLRQHLAGRRGALCRKAYGDEGDGTTKLVLATDDSYLGEGSLVRHGRAIIMGGPRPESLREQKSGRRAPAAELALAFA